MRHFDDWVTHPAVTRQGVEAFITDPTLIGRDYLDRYVVCTTSGSTGTPAIRVHDKAALVVYAYFTNNGEGHHARRDVL